MPSSILAIILATTWTAVTAAPFKFPLPDGFPNPSNDTVRKYEEVAGGLLGNGEPAPRLDEDSLTSCKLMTFNEFSEVAFFTELIANITQRVPGYVLEPDQEPSVLDTLRAIQATEELHAYDANVAVNHFTGLHILPCEYDFPVNDYPSAVAFAGLFTDVALGTMADIQKRTTAALGAGAHEIVFNLAGILGQEGQQDGWFHVVQGKRPSPQPFLTASAREFAFNALLQRTIVPGSCPNLTDIPLRVYEPLTVLTSDVAVDGAIEFQATGTDSVSIDASSQRIAYLNSNSVPIVVPFNVSRTTGRTVTFAADFPYREWILNGLTVATVVDRSGPFHGPDDMADATVFGPAIIEIN